MALWIVWDTKVKRKLEQARNFEQEQERRLLEAYARGRRERRRRRREKSED